MAQGWQITCGKCGEVAPASQWMGTDKVLLRMCDFQCPHCKVGIKRVLHDVKIIRNPEGEPLFAHGRVEIEEVA